MAWVLVLVAVALIVVVGRVVVEAVAIDVVTG